MPQRPAYPERGAIVTWDGDAYVVVSGNMFNSLPDEPDVIVVALSDGQPGLLTVSLTDGWIAVPGALGTVPKAELSPTARTATLQELTDIDNMIARILATN